MHLIDDAKLALDCIIEACEGPLSSTILNMIRTALPGVIHYIVFEISIIGLC